MTPEQVTVLHKIVTHLPLAPYLKDELLEEVTAAFGEKEETEDAEE